MSDTDSIPDLLWQWAQQQPDAPALIAEETVLSYAELERRVAATARRLAAPGVPERLAIYATNGWTLVVLLLAAVRARRVACLLSTRVPPSALAPLLETVAASVLVSDREGLSAHVPGAEVVRLDALIGEGGAAGQPAPVWRLDQPATVVFTSGSTGRPKAALHSVGNHVFSAKGSNANIPLAPGDRWLLSLPLYHVGGLAIVFRCLLGGAAAVLPARGISTGEAFGRYRITHASLVATQLGRLMREESARPERVRAVLLGGSAIPAALLEEAHARGWPLHTSYGLTEMASQVATTPPGAPLGALHSSGRLLPHRHLKIAPDGEILVRGATLFLGYLDGDRLHRPLDADGYFATHDLGRLDAEQWLHVAGRADNQFISGGENIQPEEIERALSQVGGVRRAIVVPVADAEFGQRPVAFVEGAAEAGQMVKALEERLPRFKIPVAFYDWPAEAGGGLKPDRQVLRERAERLKGEKS